VAYLDTGGDTGGSPPPDRVDPAPDPGDIFQDDFESVSKKNWDTDKEENFAIKYSDDALKLSTEPSSSVAELKGEDAGKPLDVDDVSVEADITQVSDNTDGEASWGLVCRAEDYDNYYVALLWSNGDVIISKVKNDNFADPLDNADGSEAFDGSTATNHIRFDCVGKTLTMYLNDQEVAKAKDSTFATGTIGLSVNSDDTSSKVEASFDNLLVSSP